MSEILALKYRPHDFESVVGQTETVRQISGALKKGSLGHALIFAGTRGCGKTTTARIVARHLNPELSDAELGMVVMEVDAASNTGVDNVRELIDNIRYSTKGHKVIILDEAHMLSKNAFNALLKTLEEPPPGVTFILSTTEPHKLLPTVRSRCQLYEFKDVDVDTLVEHYRKVSKEEGLDLADEVLHDIAIRAEGSVRDGLTILQKHLSGEEVESNASTYFELVSALYQGDVATSLALVSELRKKEDARVIIQTLEKWFYWCSLENFGSRTPARQHFPEGQNLVFDLTHLQNLFNICLDVERNFAATPNSKSVLEMGIISLCL
ncbi:MAG: DNA polymerase III subunit gamma/tau [Candidatus Altiarchaeales archaeon]|nr:DNA polymerase III subunit gamma/tau [Candidatus Altiarchaeales archaeon]